MLNKLNLQKKDHLKIIVTDSGLGGLSVQALLNKELQNSRFQNIEIVYFNSLAHPQYGYNSLKNKSDKLSVFNNALIGMVKHEPDIILIACNTLSVIYHQTEISKQINIPVIGIVENGVEMVLEAVKNHLNYDIIILGTETTINSNQHKKSLIEKGIVSNKIITQACKNLESEIQNDPKGKKVRELIEKYLVETENKIVDKSAKQFVLFACTHYGYSTNIFNEVCSDLFGNNFEILNPNLKMAKVLNEQSISEMKVNTSIKNKVLSKVKLFEVQIENLSELLKIDSIDTAQALKDYEYVPELFDFDKGRYKIR